MLININSTPLLCSVSSVDLYNTSIYEEKNSFFALFRIKNVKNVKKDKKISRINKIRLSCSLNYNTVSKQPCKKYKNVLKSSKQEINLFLTDFGYEVL